MPNFFSEFSDKSGCLNSGMCSVDPSSYALEELLLNEIKQIAFYVVKLSEFSRIDTDDIQNAMAFAVKALTVVILNTAIRLEDYKELIYGLENEKNKTRESYLECCKNKKIKYELVENAIALPKKASLNDLLKAGEAIVVEKQREYEPKKLDLIELIIIFAKTTAINVEKLKHLGFENGELNFKILKFLNVTNIPANKIEKLKRKICDFSKTSLEVWKKLIQKTEEKYGAREDGHINIEIKEGKSILVSGVDLDELEKLLNAAENSGVNVYTNSALFMAYAYPYFRKYKCLKGHFGSYDVQTDFTNFKGPVFATQNFLQRVDYLRRGTIYTTKIVAPERMVHIKNYDFRPLIENALKSEGFLKEDEKVFETVELKYNREEIDKIIEGAKEGEICVIVGSYKKEETAAKFKGKTLIMLDSPVEIQLLIHILEKTGCKNLTLVFMHCGLSIINILLSTLDMNPEKIYFAECPNSLINPHVIKALREEFGVEGI